MQHRKSTATAEELLHQLQKELSSFYNEIVGEPEEEDVANDDITMLNSIREAYYKLQEEVSSVITISIPSVIVALAINRERTLERK